MRRILGELALLSVGVALGITLVLATTFRPINHETAWITWGYPFVWRSAASASPLYLYPLALYEDIAFWLIVSLAFVEFPVRIVTLSAGLSLRKSADPGRLLSVPRSSGQQGPPSRSSLVVASAIIIVCRAHLGERGRGQRADNYDGVPDHDGHHCFDIGPDADDRSLAEREHGYHRHHLRVAHGLHRMHRDGRIRALLGLQRVRLGRRVRLQLRGPKPALRPSDESGVHATRGQHDKSAPELT